MSGIEAVAAVARGETSASNLHADAMERIAEWEPGLGAVVDEIEFREPVDGPLTGMMFGIKTQVDVAGYPNWEQLQRNGAEADPVLRNATVVDRLISNGATLICTTAAPFIGAPGGVTPQTRNPRSPDRVSGGSSGGSAAALAAGLVHGALGSDSGGSIRIPAACCGVVGMQTTRGLVPLTGASGLTHSIGNVGPMATTVADTRLILDAIAGVATDDPYSVLGGPPEPWNGRQLRVGLPAELTGWNIDPLVAGAFEAAVDQFRLAGHRVEEVSLPLIREAMQLGPATIGVAESGAIMEDLFGDNLEDNAELAGAVAAAKAIDGPTLARANHRVAQLRSEVLHLLSGYDILLTPTLPCRVPDGSTPNVEVDLDVGGATETRTSALTRLVNPWNLAALPAGTLPIARDEGGAAVSLQVVGPPFSDWKVLDVMEFVEDALGGPWDTVCPPE